LSNYNSQLMSFQVVIFILPIPPLGIFILFCYSRCVADDENAVSFPFSIANFSSDSFFGGGAVDGRVS